MQEAELGWATYYLEVCLTAEEAEAAYLRWSELAIAHPGAEVRLLRLPIGDTRALFCIVSQTRELVPPEVLRWHERLAAYYEVDPAAEQRTTGWAGVPTEGSDPPLSAWVSRMGNAAEDRAVRTPEAWDAFMRNTARRRRRSGSC